MRRRPGAVSVCHDAGASRAGLTSARRAAAPPPAAEFVPPRRASRGLVDHRLPLAEREPHQRPRRPPTSRRTRRSGSPPRPRARGSSRQNAAPSPSTRRVDEVRAGRPAAARARPPAAPRTGGRAWRAKLGRQPRVERRRRRPAPPRPRAGTASPPANDRNCLAARTPADQRRRPARPADLPARHRERLAERGDRQRALGHPVERRERDVLALVDEVLVDLVGRPRPDRARRQSAARPARARRARTPCRSGCAASSAAPAACAASPPPPARPGRSSSPAAAASPPAAGAPAIAMLAAYESYSGSNTTTSSPGSSSPSIAAAIASVAPKVTCTSSTLEAVEALLVRGDRVPQRRHARPAARTGCARPAAPRRRPRAPRSGPSSSGNPWPRLTAPVRSASADISVKIVVPNPARREATTGAAYASQSPRASSAA